MNNERIFSLLKNNIIQIVPQLQDRTILVEDSLRDLGADSIERAAILIKTMSDLDVTILLNKFNSATNIEGIIGIFNDHI